MKNRFYLILAALLALALPAQAATDMPSRSATASVGTNSLFLCRASGATSDEKCTGAQVKAYTTTSANQLSVYAAGTVYHLTNTSAVLDFGTTDPTLTITAAGTYLVSGSVTLDYAAATFAANRTVTLKIRRTNNTAADLTDCSIALGTNVVTTTTGTMERASWTCVYTTLNSTDSISIQGDVGTVPTAGNLDAAAASIVAVRLQQ